MYSKQTEPRRSDKIETISPNIIEVSENPGPHETQAKFYVFDLLTETGEPFLNKADAVEAALVLLDKAAKAVVVKAASFVDADVLFKRNKGIAY